MKLAEGAGHLTYCTNIHPGETWAEVRANLEKFFPAVADTLLENQNTDGSWDPERDDERWGNSLTTAMVVLALSAPNELLPIFQR